MGNALTSPNNASGAVVRTRERYRACDERQSLIPFSADVYFGSPAHPAAANKFIQQEGFFKFDAAGKVFRVLRF